MSGAFITVEGADGSGKTTHLDFIQRRLADAGVNIVRTREPGGTDLGEALRKILLTGEAAVSARAELLLMFAARAQHLHEVIVPALAAGDWVLCDRFTDATYAYQGGGRGVGDDDIAALEKFVQGGLQPDLTLLLDVPVAVGEARTNDRRRDRFERQSPAFKDAVRRAYCARAKKFSRIQLINADQAMDKVQADLIAALDAFRRRRTP